ncbi:hypothetical protein N7528_004143 [Penicillium herquei]|nr:hypothetical protein N7528_004143 [Penicillium herquei]
MHSIERLGALLMPLTIKFTLFHSGTTKEAYEALQKAINAGHDQSRIGLSITKDESHIVVRKAISYLYTQSYDEYQEGDDDGTSEFSELQLHARVFAFADRYCIP